MFQIYGKLKTRTCRKLFYSLVNCVDDWFQGNEHDFNLHIRRNDLVQKVVGAGGHRKVILSDGLNHDSRYSHEGQSYAIPVATVEFASLCVRNALLLLPSPAAPDDATQTPDAAGTESSFRTETGEVTPQPQRATELLAAPPSAPLSHGEVGTLRCSVLAAGAYVALCVGDCLVALDHAQKLLLQPRLSGSHK